MNRVAARSAVTRKDVSRAVAELMPQILRGVQLDFFVKRGVTQTQFLLLAAIRAYGRPSIPRLVSLARDRGERGHGPSRTTTGSGRPPRAQSRGGRCTMGTLARSLHVSMPTVSGVVERLVRAGYLRRIPQVADRRQVVVELTAKAQTFFREFEEVVRRRWEEVLVALDQEELEAFHHVLTALRQRLQADAR